MKVEIKDAGVCRKTMTIDIPVETVAEEMKAVTDQFCSFASLPGFRKGKAPRKLVEKRHAKDIAEQVGEMLLPRCYQQAREEQGVEVVRIINVVEPVIQPDAPARIEVTVDVAPEFKLPKYEGISVKSVKEDVSEAKVDETVQMMLRQYATYEDIEDRPVSEGDMAELTYEAKIDGQPLEEVCEEGKGLGKGEGWWMLADEEGFLPDMGKALVGLNIGDEKDVPVTFRDEFVVKELAGKTADYHVKVTGIREQRMPEMDEEFLSKMGAQSEDEMRGRMREYLESAEERREKSAIENAIVEHLLAKTKLDVPESLVQEQTRNVMYELARQRMSQGLSRDQMAQESEKLFEDAKKLADDRVKLRFITAEIAKAEGVEVTPAEVQQEIAMMAVQQRTDAAKLRQQIEENGDLDSVKAQIVFSKVMELLAEKAKIK